MSTHLLRIAGSGTPRKIEAVDESAGVEDAGKIPMLNSSGLIDESMVQNSPGGSSATTVVLETPVSTVDNTAIIVEGFSIDLESDSLYDVSVYCMNGSGEDTGYLRATAPTDAHYTLNSRSGEIQNNADSGASTTNGAPIPDGNGYNGSGVVYTGYVKSVTAGTLQFTIKRAGSNNFTLDAGSVLSYMKVS